jgi:glycosyltransferase involved in cell wall biosynthesis
MKIIHVNGYFKEDIVYQENLLTVGQYKLGHEVYLITSCYEPEMKINYGNRRKKSGEYDYNGVKVIRVDDYFELKKNALVIVKSILPILKNIKPDIIFFHDVSHLLFYGIIYKKLNPSVSLHIDFHSDEYNAINSSIGHIYHFFWRLFFILFSNKFDKYFAVAPEAEFFIKKYYKIPQNKITLLPLPGDSSYLNHSDKIKGQFRSSLSISESSKIFVHTGKLPQGKETSLVLNAFMRIQNPYIRLLIAGSIDDDYLSQFYSYLNNDNRIIFLGWLKPYEMNELLISSDIMIQPGSLSHTFVESICCGLPLILNDTPQGRNLTSSGNGILLKNKSIDELCNIMEYVLIEENYVKLKNSALKAAMYYDHVNISRISLS